jgi:hypothetical protein
MHKLWPHSVKKAVNKNQNNGSKSNEEKTSSLTEDGKDGKTEASETASAGGGGDEAQSNGTENEKKQQSQSESNKTAMCLINELVKLNKV